MTRSGDQTRTLASLLRDGDAWNTSLHRPPQHTNTYNQAITYETLTETHTQTHKHIHTHRNIPITSLFLSLPLIIPHPPSPTPHPPSHITHHPSPITPPPHIVVPLSPLLFLSLPLIIPPSPHLVVPPSPPWRGAPADRDADASPRTFGTTSLSAPNRKSCTASSQRLRKSNTRRRERERERGREREREREREGERGGEGERESSVNVYMSGFQNKGGQTTTARNKQKSYHTIPHHTYHTIPYHTTPHHTIPHHTTPYHTIPHHTTPTIPYHTTPYHTIPYHTYIPGTRTRRLVNAWMLLEYGNENEPSETLRTFQFQ